MPVRAARPNGMRTPKTPHGRRLVIPGPRRDSADPMAVLTPLQLRILHLRVVDGHTAEQVATKLDMSPTAVRITQHRALQRLREQLGDDADTT
ncbi:RNA polymerase sigma-70 factor (ECF subfamily) [Actinokineospora baliensis]|uniref:sigma factor-like helix-turn-helix DNA-binding protein n=1 Tax=Actinokineospora baliensis TaxID=547056 RepID=UPI00195C538D|nr:sigma factor-like helix-turn-helix DNA-binding protein [Actinokineospora baliensis]MBM7773642.1 RNA polymerase sigma-70 factor (ECF subfamily) [Actinokineospora baliensis]